MSHEFESGIFTKTPAWHGLGVVLDNPPTIQEALVKSGLDWNVGLKDLYTEDGIKVSHKATYRETDGSILGCVGPKYFPMQNVDCFKWFEPFLETQEATIETAGSLFKGRRVWVLAKIQRNGMTILPGDTVEKYLLLSNSHDGSRAIKVGYNPIRVVCANTMAMADRSALAQMLRVRHTAGAVETLNNIRDIMNNIDAEFEATAEQYRHLASRQVKASDLKRYVKIVLDCEATPDAELSPRTFNNMAKILELVQHGPGTDIPGVGGTWWNCYNAVNGYIAERGRTPESNLDSLWFSNGATDNKRMLDLALTLAV